MPAKKDEAKKDKPAEAKKPKAAEAKEEKAATAKKAKAAGAKEEKAVEVKHILEFKENLRVLLISSLFILLAARLRPESLQDIGVAELMFLGALIVVVRPVAVWISALGSEFTWRERALIASIAPRGIVAAAVSSIFTLETHAGT